MAISQISLCSKLLADDCFPIYSNSSMFLGFFSAVAVRYDCGVNGLRRLAVYAFWSSYFRPF